MPPCSRPLLPVTHTSHPSPQLQVATAQIYNARLFTQASPLLPSSRHLPQLLCLSTLLFFSFVKSVVLFLCPDSLGSRWLIAPGKPPRLLTTATSWPSNEGGAGSEFSLL